MSLKVVVAFGKLAVVCVVMSFLVIMFKRMFGDVQQEPFANPDCSTIPLAAFNESLVLSYLTPQIQYDISMYSTGDPSFQSSGSPEPKGPQYGVVPQTRGVDRLKQAFETATPDVQMAMSALLGRYIALNGGSAAIPGPGYLFTSTPGNYRTQLSTSDAYLIPKTINKDSPLYPSFFAATSVARCPKQNKAWVSTADFATTLPMESDLYQYATADTGIGPAYNA
jgi:hypothetical protein